MPENNLYKNISKKILEHKIPEKHKDIINELEKELEKNAKFRKENFNFAAQNLVSMSVFPGLQLLSTFIVCGFTFATTSTAVLACMIGILFVAAASIYFAGLLNEKLQNDRIINKHISIDDNANIDDNATINSNPNADKNTIDNTDNKLKKESKLRREKFNVIAKKLALMSAEPGLQLLSTFLVCGFTFTTTGTTVLACMIGILFVAAASVYIAGIVNEKLQNSNLQTKDFELSQ